MVVKSMVVKNINKAIEHVNSELTSLALNNGDVSKIKKAWLNRLLGELTTLKSKVVKLHANWYVRGEKLTTYNKLANLFKSLLIKERFFMSIQNVKTWACHAHGLLYCHR